MSTKLFRKVFDLDRAPTIKLSLQDIPLKAQEMVGKMSISGAQQKLSIKLDRTQAELVSAAEDGEFILKPQTQQFPYTPENENCCMDIAESLGIEVPPHCLLPLTDGSTAYIVKRFDRARKEKLHQESFFQILGKESKYNGSIEQIGNILKDHSSIPGLDVQLFFELVTLNFLIGNGDAHLGNYSVIHKPDGIRLTPAYDIVCSKLVIPGEYDSALTFNGKHNNLQRKDFDTSAEYLGIPAKICYQKFVGKLDKMKAHIQASKLPGDFQTKFIEIVSSRYARLGIQRE